MSEERARGIDANHHPWTRWFFSLRPFIQFIVMLGAAASVLGGAAGIGWAAKDKLSEAETVIPRLLELESWRVKHIEEVTRPSLERLYVVEENAKETRALVDTLLRQRAEDRAVDDQVLLRLTRLESGMVRTTCYLQAQAGIRDVSECL